MDRMDFSSSGPVWIDWISRSSWDAGMGGLVIKSWACRSAQAHNPNNVASTRRCLRLLKIYLPAAVTLQSAPNIVASLPHLLPRKLAHTTHIPTFSSVTLASVNACTVQRCYCLFSLLTRSNYPNSIRLCRGYSYTCILSCLYMLPHPSIHRSKRWPEVQARKQQATDDAEENATP